MSNLIILFIHLIATIARLLGSGGMHSVVAESLFVKQQPVGCFRHQLLVV